ncbi:hypothetical protein JW964_28785, partial [candidate division KSB1 bacterium]|nr:hypothetical protein [candidate division KSB1 bacterium]
MMIRVFLRWYIVVFFLPFLGCSVNINESNEKFKFPSSVKVTPFQINKLSFEDWPYNNQPVVYLDDEYLTDEKGIILFEHNGIRYYHPVYLGLRAIELLNGYYRTKNTTYLLRAKLFAEKLIETGEEIDKALYFPYPFNWTHGTDKLFYPWYSGMAQGRVLSVFSRLYFLTGEKKYLNIAQKIFKSFQIIYCEKDGWKNDFIWTVMIDKNGYFWIEQYPAYWPSHVLNGFIAAIFGLHDYYQVSKDESCQQILLASLTTVQNHLDQYRNPGSVSFYCLKFKELFQRYHKTHIEQLQELYKMTNDFSFKVMA